MLLTVDITDQQEFLILSGLVPSFIQFHNVLSTCSVQDGNYLAYMIDTHQTWQPGLSSEALSYIIVTNPEKVSNFEV